MRELIEKLERKNYSTYDIYWFTNFYWIGIIPPIVIYDFGNLGKSEWSREYWRKEADTILKEALIEVDFWPYKEDQNNHLNKNNKYE